jgi:hypothetical protein
VRDGGEHADAKAGSALTVALDVVDVDPFCSVPSRSLRQS